MSKKTINWKKASLFLWAAVIVVLLLMFITPHTKYKVIEVVDGDTIVIEQGSNKKRVRILGIDAPELEQPYGPRAHALLEETILEKNIILKNETSDNYERIIATIIYPSENKDIGLFMLNQGLAWCYNTPPELKETYKLAQSIAGKEKRGLWADKKPIPPWKDRASHN